MPRPKVLPSQRKRAAEACSFCRTSKKKCSATVPCTACQRRGIGHTCYLTNSPRASRSAPRRSLQDAPTHGSPINQGPSLSNESDHNSRDSTAWPLSGSPRAWLPSQPTPSLHQDAYQPISPSDSRTAITDAHPTEPDPSPQGQSTLPETPALGPESHARMLLNLRGERG